MAIDPVTTGASAQALPTPDATSPAQPPTPEPAATPHPSATAGRQATAEQPLTLDPAQDPATWAPVLDAAPRCPWCFEVLPATDLARCPSCKAQLHGSLEAVPGLTEVDPTSLKPVVSREPVRRSRLLAWISGEVVDEAGPTPVSDRAALAPPSADVRREMLRLELEAFGIQMPADEVAPTGDAAGPIEPAGGGESGSADESNAA